MRHLLIIKINILFLLLLPSCIKLNAEPANSDTTHVIILGFDGWDSTSFDSADMPFLKSILSESAWTLHKRSILPSSSACNWATMFKGAGPEAHGYIDWNTRTPAFEVTEKNKKGYFPSLFSIFRSAHPDAESGYYYQWEGMRYLFDMDDFSRFLQFSDSENGSDQMRDAAIAYIITKKPSLAAFIWDYPDKIGHTAGWDSDEYLAELTHIDAIIESIVSRCKEAGIYDNTVFIITSDHGGHGTNHGQPVMSDLETPFIIIGSGIQPGEITTPLMQYDVASILADYMRLSQPSAWRGRTPSGILK